MDNVHDYFSMCNVMATKISVSQRMMWKLGSKCLHDALSATVWGGTHVVHTFLLYCRMLVRVMVVAQDADSLLHGVPFEYEEVCMNSIWRDSGGLQRENGASASPSCKLQR